MYAPQASNIKSLASDPKDERISSYRQNDVIRHIKKTKQSYISLSEKDKLVQVHRYKVPKSKTSGASRSIGQNTEAKLLVPVRPSAAKIPSFKLVQVHLNHVPKTLEAARSIGQNTEAKPPVPVAKIPSLKLVQVHLYHVPKTPGSARRSPGQPTEAKTLVRVWPSAAKAALSALGARGSNLVRRGSPAMPRSHGHHGNKSHHSRSHQSHGHHGKSGHGNHANHHGGGHGHHHHHHHHRSAHGGGEDEHESPGKYEELAGSAIQGEGLDSVLGSFATYARLKGRYDDDWIDRLNHLYTTIILIIFTIVVSTKQYVGEPIHCWCPAQFEESQVDYTNNVCWISNTYHVPFDDIPPRHTRPYETEIGYYQWVPMILLFQALLFKVPCILWRILTASAGVNLDKIVTLAAETAYVAPDERDRTIKHIVRYMDRWIESAREYRSGCFIRLRQQISKYCCLVWGKRYGNYLVTIYMFIKLLYLTNAIGQLFILNEFLGTNYNVYGFEVMDHLARGIDWSESPRFPRVTHCYFEIRQMQNVHQYTVQCVLPINLFNEKIFIFIWFWLVFVATLSAANFLIWVYSMIFRQHRLRYLKKFLRINDCYKSELDKKMAVKFAEQYLRQDGIFVLRLVGKNANDVLVSELILQLWNHYRNKPLFRHANQISDDNSNV